VILSNHLFVRLEMSPAKQIKNLKHEINRLKKAKQSDFARPIDSVNLINARDKLAQLLKEAELDLDKLV